MGEEFVEACERVVHARKKLDYVESSECNKKGTCSKLQTS